MPEHDVTIDWNKHYNGDHPDISATISTIHWVDKAFDLETAHQSAFFDWANEPDKADLDWFECGADFAEFGLGLKLAHRNNVYNLQQDFDQVFVFEVWHQPDGRATDWIYDDEAIVLLYPHTGCDVRGGYAPPLILKAKGEYSMPLDYQAEFRATSGKDKHGVELTDHDFEQLSERWTCGYSSWPAGEVQKDIAKVIKRVRTALKPHVPRGHHVTINWAPNAEALGVEAKHTFSTSSQ